MKRILLVDDDFGNRVTLSVLLEDEGFHVEMAASFAQGMAKLTAPGAAFDVVLLDHHLGDGLGTDLVPILRARLPEARAILISGSMTDEEARTIAKADALVVKGIAFPGLLALIRGDQPA